MTNKTISLTLIILLMCTTGCKTSLDENIELGAILILTGNGMNWGIKSMQGAELAVEEINENGGVNGKKIHVNYQDMEGGYNVRETLNSYRSLRTKGINVILGPNWSPEGKAVAPLACDDKVLMISPTLGTEDFNEECGYIFNLWPHDVILSEHIGEYLYDKGFREIAIVGMNRLWEEKQASAVKKGFEKKGGSVVLYELPNPDVKDYSAEALKIKESNSEAIVLTNYGSEHLVAKKLKQIGVELPIFPFLLDQDRVDAGQGAFEGAVFMTSFTPTEEFQKKFFYKYGTEPELGADTSYDAIMLLAEAMKVTESTNTAKLKNYINNLTIYNGASGKMIFDGKGGVTKQPKFMVVKNNALVELN